MHLTSSHRPATASHGYTAIHIAIHYTAIQRYTSYMLYHSCAIALRSPASEQSSDLTRMSPDFHKISQLTSKMPPTAPTTARASEPRSAHHRTALYAGDSLAQDA